MGEVRLRVTLLPLVGLVIVTRLVPTLVPTLVKPDQLLVSAIVLLMFTAPEPMTVVAPMLAVKLPGHDVTADSMTVLEALATPEGGKTTVVDVKLAGTKGIPVAMVVVEIVVLKAPDGID